jgi:hypothetical protein
MPHTPEQRDKHGLCGARKKNGESCRAFAGQGTDHGGTGRCKNHGGATRSHKTHAVVTEAKRRMVKLGEPVPEMEPHQALLALLRATAGHVAWLHREVAGLEDLSRHESRVIIELYDSERDRLTRIAKACSDVGVSEREIRIQENVAALFGSAVDKAASALGMNAEQRRKLHIGIAQELDTAHAPNLDHLREPGAVFSGN